MPTIFSVCEPRLDVLKGAIHESDFAADLAQVLRGDAPDEYTVPAKFFANTYPTRGLKNLLHNVALRLSGSPDQIGSIFRLDTQFGGGKTHALIALAHAVRGMKEVTNVAEFIDPARLPKFPVHIAAFAGENADPANGRRMSDKVRAYTPWGEIAYGLGDDIFLRGIRLGIEQGEYVYKSGELLLGKGDPFAEIKIDEQSLIFTVAYAREHNIWPRSAPPHPTPGGASISSGLTATTTATAPTHIVLDSSLSAATATEPNLFSVEDALRAAMAQACEKAQQASMQGVAKLWIRPFDVQDALRLLSVLNSVSNANKKVELAVEIEAKDGSNVQIVFRGSIAEALPLKDYLEPQIRAAQDNDVQCK